MTQQWKLVPVEPTPKMVDATWNDSVDRDGGIESQNTRNRRIYAAMVNAAPIPPASAQPERDWELTCDECNGDGFVYVERQVAERKSDVQEFKEDCECCEGRGFTIAFEDIPGIDAYVKSRRPAPASAQDDAKDERQEWMTCTMRHRMVVDNLRFSATHMRDKENRARTAYQQDYMGAPMRWLADVYADAAAVFEAKLAALSASQQQEG